MNEKRTGTSRIVGNGRDQEKRLRPFRLQSQRVETKDCLRKESHDQQHRYSIFDSGENILEAEIVETLLPNLEEDLLLIGQEPKVSSAAVKGVFSNRRRRKPRKGIDSFQGLRGSRQP